MPAPASDEDLETTPAWVPRAGERRQNALVVLEESPTPLSMADLARDVVERDLASEPETTDWEAVRRCYVALYHYQIPKLADEGMVAFDPDRRTVERR